MTDPNDGTNVPRVPRNPKRLKGSRDPHRRGTPWYSTELDTMWAHPDMTAEELHELIPRHSPKAIRNMRSRAGRYNLRAVPMCQRCGEHPVAVEDPWAKARWLCAACALEEKDWQDRYGEQIKKANNARRQRKKKRKDRGER